MKYSYFYNKKSIMFSFNAKNKLHIIVITAKGKSALQQHSEAS